MAVIETLASNSEFVRQTAEEATGLIKRIFGKSIDEYGELLADGIRLKRFKNQISIFKKAEEFLKSEKINPEKINLKVLAPLIEYSSYEDDETLQFKWAYLIKNILIKPFNSTIQITCSQILNKISSDEALLLDYLYDGSTKKRIDWANNENTQPSLFGDKFRRQPTDYRIDWITFELSNLSRELNKPLEELELQISNLVSLGTVKFVPEVEVISATADRDSSDGEVEIELDITDYEKIQLTKLGFIFVELCKT
jgi:hypothetical protein